MFSLSISFGSVPDSLLLMASIVSSKGRSPISVGIVPDSSFERMSKLGGVLEELDLSDNKQYALSQRTEFDKELFWNGTG